MHFDPSETYVHLTAGGAAERLPGGEQFWSMPEPEIDRYGHGWLISEFECSADWSSWEMHPEAEESVYLLSGAAHALPTALHAHAKARHLGLETKRPNGDRR